MSVDIHGQSSVGVAQDTLGRLRVNLLFYDEHRRQRMPEGVKARPSRVLWADPTRDRDSQQTALPSTCGFPHPA